MSAKPDNVIRLRDGRLLGYAEYGDPTGTPLFFFHGTPGSRLGGQLGHRAAEEQQIRLIAPDRPGHGLSDHSPRREIDDWPADVVELADGLEIERFSVAGVSGGGPYAAICALAIDDRLTAAGIISGAGPPDLMAAAASSMNPQNRTFFRLSRRLPWLLSPIMWGVARTARSRQYASLLMRSISGPDRAVFDQPNVKEAIDAEALEAFRSGSQGVVRDCALFAGPWGFRLEEIGREVHLWHGERDSNVPVEVARRQAEVIPHCRAMFYPDEGHFVWAIHFDEIGQALCLARRKPGLDS